MLERASVIGHDFEWEALGELSPDRRRPPGAQLAALVRNELIRPHAAIPDTFSFRHALIRDAAYTRLPKERRSDLHERCADWLDGRGDEFEEMIGYHLEQANRWVVELGPADERAIPLAARSADSLAASGKRAYAPGDGPAAAKLLERSIALLAVDDAVRLRLMPLLGRAHRDAAWSARRPSSRRHWSARVRSTSPSSRPTPPSRSSTFTSMRRRPRGRRCSPRSIPTTRVYAEYGDEAGLGRALALGGKLRFWAGETAAALEELERAAGHARKAGDRYQEADCFQCMLAAVVYGPTPASDGLAFLEAMRTRLEGNRRLDMSLLNSQGRLEAMEGRFESARAALARAATLADGVLEVERYSHVLVAIADVELLAGDAAAAERNVRMACDRLEEIGELGYLASAVPTLLEALYRQGRDQEALRLSERWNPARLTVPEDVDGQAAWRSVRAKLLARRGNVAEAEELAREAMALAGATDYVDLHAEALAALGEGCSSRSDETTPCGHANRPSPCSRRRATPSPPPRFGISSLRRPSPPDPLRPRVVRLWQGRGTPAVGEGEID